MKTRTLHVATESLVMRRPFVITGYVFDAMPAVVVSLDDGTHTGRGEAAGVYYLNDGVPDMLAQIESVRADIEAGMSRQALQARLPAGGARNALDCALWELDAARAGVAVWQLAGLQAPQPLVTTMTAGAGQPAAMVETVRAFEAPRAIKLKLTGEPELDVGRVEAMRAAFPDAWLGVDANQGYGPESLRAVLPEFHRNAVRLVEQPFPRCEDASLDGIGSPIPFAADESLQTLDDLPSLVGRYQVANIKLDKSGGLTEALEMARRARVLGLQVMVGNMAGSSWAMAPAYLVGQFCDVVDLDGPLALRDDRVPGVRYEDGRILCDDAVWGRGAPSQSTLPRQQALPEVSTS